MFQNGYKDQCNNMVQYIISTFADKGLYPKYNNILLKNVHNKIYNISKHIDSIVFYDDYDWHVEIDNIKTRHNNMCRLRYLMTYDNFIPNKNFIRNISNGSIKTMSQLDALYEKFYSSYNIETLLNSKLDYFVENYDVFTNISHELTLFAKNTYNYAYRDRSDWITLNLTVS
jgi:hypothetical protein